MAIIPKIHEYMLELDFLNAKSSRDYVGKKDVNPAMFLEDNVPTWSRMSSLAELSAALAIWKERVCVSDFPARYSPPFWLAQAALQAVYKVLNSYLLTNFCEEILHEVSDLLFDLWVHLISAGPGSSHLEMMDVILKNQHFPLWKYMETLTGDPLKLLINTLKCDFVYEEDVSSVHYATLMETHIDKIFRHILRPEQFLEAHREFLDLHLYYLGRMNHVPPHIGPRLSHLCFLICQKYELENPYMGLDDWVLMRHHLKIIKDVVTDWTFTVASEAQYRAPITLEKIFQAAILDNMLEVMFKDFMTLLLAICGHKNSKKCKRLFAAYETALFQQIDPNNMEVYPEWLFDQCISTLIQLASTHGIETHIEHTMIVAEQDCLLKMTDLIQQKREKWQKLLENYIVSGRGLLVQEAVYLLKSDVLIEAGVFNWKEKLSQVRLLMDIISDLPKSFLQDDTESAAVNTVEAYAAFMLALIAQLRNAELIPKVQDNIHKCVIKCLAKDPICKARLATLCVQEEIINFQDMEFVREVLFSIEKLLKEDDCLSVNEMLSSAVESVLNGSLDTFREKGYIPVDFNSLMMSISLTCISGDAYIQTDKTGPPYDIYYVLYNGVVLQFIRMHQTHGTLGQISTMVPQVIQLIHEGIEQGTSIARCITFLHWLETSCPEVITGHSSEIIELFIDWDCYGEIYPVVPALYSTDPLSVIRKVPAIFEKMKSVNSTDRQILLTVLHLVAGNHAEVFTSEHISQLVTMYRQETATSQQLILQIIHRVALQYPSVVFGFYPLLTDDAMFSVATLKDRAPVLTALAQHNEDISKKTTDYLMTHVSNKDSAVSLVAMETLEPLLKQSLTCLMKHKQKLKTVGKMSSCQRVKEICKELVPDIQAKGTKTTQKENKPTVTEVPKIAFNKTAVEQKKFSKTTKSKKVIIAKSSPGETEVQPVVSLKETVQAIDLKLDTTLDQEIFSKGNEKVYVTNLNTEDNGKELLENRDFQSDINSATASDQKESGTKNTDLTSTTVNTDCFGSKFKADLYESHLQGITEELGAVDHIQLPQKDTISKTNESSSKEFKNGKEPSDVSESLRDNRNTNIQTSYDEGSLDRSVKEKEKTEKVTCSTSMVTDGLNGLQIDSAPIYLSFHPSCQDQVVMLRRHLRMAGYDCWVDTGQTGSGDGAVHAGIQEAKVVICCLTEKFLSSAECCKEVSTALNLSKPIIPLALQPVSVTPASQLKDYLAIRFFTKSAEVKVTMGFWTEHKFQELLMRLNYLRIFPDEKLVTKAYENWWLPKPLSDKTSNDDSVGIVTAPGFPSVFISYNWGKQNQIKHLYQKLTDLGYSCWFGVYQMSGSESLYNKITQGLQGCRVMLACVTKNYTRADNCQQEVRLAHSLKRPIIPLLLEEIRWPPENEIGKILGIYECVNLGKLKEVKSFDDFQFRKLTEKLDPHIPCKKQNSAKSDKHTVEAKEKNELGERRIQTSVNKDETTKQNETSGTSMQNQMSRTMSVKDHENKPPKPSRKSSKGKESSKKTLQKSSSMFEMEKSTGVTVINTSMVVKSKTEDDLIIKKGIPEGVLVDEMGYTVKSSRSKSCVIL